MKVMILAAGRGQRMSPLTDHCPKPLLTLCGKPLIVHHIEKLVSAGFRDIVINHAYLGHMIEEALGDGSQFGCHINYSAEKTALETAGGVANALPLLGESPFLLINGDVWTDWDYREGWQQLLLQQQISQQQDSGEDGFLWLVPNPEHNPDGDFSLHDNRVGLSSDGDACTFSGISILSPRLFRQLPSDVMPLAPILRNAINRQSLRGQVLKAAWVDVGTPQRLKSLEQSLQGGYVAPNREEAGS